MKTCPFCAEAIQDAAIVCKHCRRDLSKAPAERQKRAAQWGGLLTAGAVIMGLAIAAYFLNDHQAFLGFDADRQRWHQDCDAFVEKTPHAADDIRQAEACRSRLRGLMDTAREHGWEK